MVLEKLYKTMVELVIKVGELKQELSPAMYRVFREAERFAHEFAGFHDQHPILAVFIETTALAVLIALSASVLIEALGFGVEGVIEGKSREVFVPSTRLLTDNV